ncbi:DUF4350 domain-containing protein [Streptomyces sp. SID4982]|uniref:DUF4350 domain-containing protein n=1 Tax=Streptomyces sp. SID4982 TaxID=2690291 RepID=UPI00136AC91B|nr:DUF4350 domain-containing protein [Streptomyces sp. SID4982]MYS14137.1 DUF4350 domain-containing protein [Streptomyces sp. SID4982]
MTTSSALTARQVWTRSRGIALAVVLLLIGAVAVAVVRSQTKHGDLDPRSADPGGSRAVAELLADRGVTTSVVTTLDAARSATGPDTTLLVAVPDLLTHRQQSRLATATASSGGRTVLVAPSRWSVGRLAPGVSASPATTEATLDPGCSLPEARRAGSAETGGIRYTTTARDAESCYPSERRATLLRVPATSGTGDTVVLGAPAVLLNNRLDKQGNASLALQLLGSRPHLVWYLPSLADSSATGTDGRESLLDLLPSGWLWGTLQLFVAALVTAFWRGRRFGPLVAERLPVAIRASETTEGRARLYRKADARDRASAALRATTRTRLAPLAGIPAPQAHTPEALLPALSARLPGHGEQALHSLLFGEPPRDDAALIALTDRLDALEREVRRS